jgi:hypothetical protein
METNNTVQATLAGAPLKQEILHKTHYGLQIYIHILRKYNPDEVLHLVERDSGTYLNPFNSNKETLHIFIEKSNPQKTLNPEYACHTDAENSIPAGDAFDFAELHYKQQGAELLQTLNKELHLHIGEERKFYRTGVARNAPPPKTSSLLRSYGLTLLRSSSPQFSFFKAPITNTTPHNTVNLLQIYNVIKGNYYKERTQKLRTISDVQQARQFKAANFDYCTFSGTFTTRNDQALIKHSGLLCIDFDHIENIETLFNSLLKDDYFDTQLLFRSPSGNGLKWIISIDTTSTTHSNYFTAVANYINQTYGIEVDKSGRDLSRACFLPHDPQAYINPQLINS